jgi:predicted alpha/beta-hydrolase family hydrolase
MATKFLIDGPARAEHTILLAHGAGGPMDNPTMTGAAKALADSGFRVARFEFDYMAARRRSPARKPPPAPKSSVRNTSPRSTRSKPRGHSSSGASRWAGGSPA